MRYTRQRRPFPELIHIHNCPLRLLGGGAEAPGRCKGTGVVSRTELTKRTDLLVERKPAR